MIYTLTAVILRILSNPFSNVEQKKLMKRPTRFLRESICPTPLITRVNMPNATTGNEQDNAIESGRFGAYYLNFFTYAILTLFCIPIFILNKCAYTIDVWIYAIVGGFCGALGNSFLVKALSLGDLSVLGPINSYKCIVAMFLGIILLGELPSSFGLVGIGLIIWGSYFIFDTVEEKFSLKLLKRKDIQYRFYALVLTATEAVLIKNVIKLSTVELSFGLWCAFGMLFSLILTIGLRDKVVRPNKNEWIKLILLTGSIGIMQLSTNFVFKNMNVSYGLALFQLSTPVSVLFGYKFFKESNIKKKLIGSTIMVIGAIILIVA